MPVAGPNIAPSEWNLGAFEAVALYTQALRTQNTYDLSLSLFLSYLSYGRNTMLNILWITLYAHMLL